MATHDDASMIEHCLASIRDWIDCWVILDTGSDDATTALIEDSLQSVPGELHRRGQRRSPADRAEALTLARGRADYLLLMESENKLVVTDPEFREQLTGDGYFVRDGNTRCSYTLGIIRDHPAWTFRGAARECVVSDASLDLSKLDSVRFQTQLTEGERQQKDARDLGRLTEALEKNPGDAHALYHLGHLHAATNQHEAALECFDRLITAGDAPWEEWIWDAALQRARVLGALERRDEAIEAFLQAYERRPWRPEPLFDLALLERERSRYARAQIYGCRAMQIGEPATDLVNLDYALYRWRLPAEYALSCYRLGLHEEAVRAANRALESGKMPRNTRDSLITSRQRSVEAIYDANRPSRPGDARNRLRVVVPFYNARRFLRECVDSLAAQDYDNFTATFIDDASTDGGADLVPVDDPRFDLIRNERRLGALRNRMSFINACDERDIIAYVDGDDRLACDDALSYINELYNRHDCWMSYGQFMTQTGALGWARPYASASDLVKDLETTMHFPIHLLTHRAALFHRIAHYDPDYSGFKDCDGEWLFYASDAVIALPLFRLAGWERTRFNHRIVYLYADQHESSESVLNHEAQMLAVAAVHRRAAPPVQASIYRRSHGCPSC